MITVKALPPSRETKVIQMVVSEANFRASDHAASSPSVVAFLVKTVTNAVLSAPSANKSRSMFGTRKAMLKQSSQRRLILSANKELIAISHQTKHAGAKDRDGDQTQRAGRALGFRFGVGLSGSFGHERTVRSARHGASNCNLAGRKMPN